MKQPLTIRFLNDNGCQVTGDGTIAEAIKLTQYPTGWTFNTCFGVFVFHVWGEFCRILENNGAIAVPF